MNLIEHYKAYQARPTLTDDCQTWFGIQNCRHLQPSTAQIANNTRDHPRLCTYTLFPWKLLDLQRFIQSIGPLHLRPCKGSSRRFVQRSSHQSSRPSHPLSLSLSLSHFILPLALSHLSFISFLLQPTEGPPKCRNSAALCRSRLKWAVV